MKRQDAHDRTAPLTAILLCGGRGERLRPFTDTLPKPLARLYGDTLANVDLRALRRTHQTSGALATLTTYPLYSTFGIVDFDEEGRVSAFTEKPRLPYWINIGFILCEPAAFDLIEPR